MRHTGTKLCLTLMGEGAGAAGDPSTVWDRCFAGVTSAGHPAVWQGQVLCGDGTTIPGLWDEGQEPHR